jgi:translocator protein
MKIKQIIKLLVLIIVCQSAGLIGSFFTMPAIPGWYQGLIKPALNPPNWLFGPVWTLLYTLMAISLFLVLKNSWQEKRTKQAVIVFSLQLLLNTSWSIVFFGLQNLFLAFINIIILLFFIVWTTIIFYRISKTAGYLFLPYLFWVSFACYLNLSIWLLN